MNMFSSGILFIVIVCFNVEVVHNSNIFFFNDTHSRISRQVHSNGCILPQHPKFGNWQVYQAANQPHPGIIVPVTTILKVICQDKYKLDGDATVVCFDNGWSTEIGQCLKTCLPIYSTPVMTVTCIRNNRETENCTNAVDGTKAKFRCADFYEDQSLERNPVHVCFNGKWSSSAPECVPMCGQKSTTKDPTLIVNGNNATRGDYPWQVALYETKSKTLICGGSLLNQRVILTAAHCVTDEDSNVVSKESLTIAVGKYYRKYNDSRDAHESQFSSVYQLYIPKQYKGDVQNYLGDIAVIITQKTFTLSTSVQPVCIDWASKYTSLLDATRTKHGYVSGWGYTVEYNTPSEVLKELKVPLITDDQCNRELPLDYQRFMTDDKICAGYLESGTSVCRGDSGGGLVVHHNGRYYLVAVVSLSPQAPTREGGCDSQQYALYTRIANYIDSFILEKEARFRPSIFEETETTVSPVLSTTTITPISTVTKGKCILPPYPSSGRWEIFGSTTKPSPGSSVSPGTILKFYCETGYELIGEQLILCENGLWPVQPPTQCLQLCPPIFSQETFEITCSFGNNETISCDRPAEGTIAKYECAPFYEDLQLAKNPVRVCRNGSWDLGKPSCIPVCGKKSVDVQTLIVNGTIANRGDYPWHVALYRGRSKRFVCSGALISQKVILTAAHCVTLPGGQTNSKRDYTISVGKFYRDFFDPLDLQSQSSQVEEIFIPLQYGGTKTNYLGDIAVIVAKSTFKLSRKVQPVCVDWAQRYDINTISSGFVSGWGYTAPNTRLSDELRELEVPLATKKQCLDVFSEDFQGFVTDDKFCAGYINKSTSICNGDAGGALVVRKDGRYFVTGIASIAKSALTGGCDTAIYALFTKVGDYINFILEKDAQFRPFVSGDGDCSNNGNCQIPEKKPNETSPASRVECILPNYPPFGSWRIYDLTSNSQKFIPGNSVALGTILIVSCNDNYKLEGDSIILCENGKWSSNIGTCLKTCPPVYSTSVLKATCIIKGKEVENCTEPTDGTKMKYECAPFYEDQKLLRNPVHICIDGSWDHLAPQCTPICGQKSVTPQMLIVNGKVAKKGEYPWHVGLYLGPDKQFVCSGSLITEKSIVTGAQCVTDSNGKVNVVDIYTVAVGKYYRKFDDTREQAGEFQFSSLENILVPPQYKGRLQNFVGDIAILITSEPFKLTQRVQPVCMDWSLKYDKEYLNNVTAYVSGWGYTSYNAHPSDELRDLEVPVISNDKCAQEFPQDFVQYFTYDKICAGYLNNGTSLCLGDSGGGLVVKHDGRYYLTGIVDIAPRTSRGGCDTENYALYTKISSYINNFIYPKLLQVKGFGRNQ